MKLATLRRRNLAYHWRVNAAVAAGVAVATAVLSGALLVGDSLRGSLREQALSGLGRVDYALHGQRFFPSVLAGRLSWPARFDQPESQPADSQPEGPSDSGAFAIPALLVRASAVQPDTQRRANHVQVVGVDASLLQAVGSTDPALAAVFSDERAVMLNEPLAKRLGVHVGEDLLLRLLRPSAISSETLLGRRDDPLTAMRLTVRGILPPRGLGAFALEPSQTGPLNACVATAALQRALAQPERANTILVAAAQPQRPTADDLALLARLLSETALPADVGLRFHFKPPFEWFLIDSETLLIPPPLERAIRLTADGWAASTAPVLAYLANEIGIAVRDGHAPRSIPYSTVAAIEPASFLAKALTVEPAGAADELRPGEILLNEWAAGDLDARPGDALELTYYVAGPLDRLETRRAEFTLRGVVKITGPAADAGLVPEYPGITDAKTMSDWDPPFPIDLQKIRPRDEEYWEQHRTTPKAFVTMADGQRLWGEQGERFGHFTSICVRTEDPAALGSLFGAFQQDLIMRADLAAAGLRFEPVRAQALAASRGTTDFAGLFLAFSFFLILSAVLLVALLFRLGVERRAREIGTLLALGLGPKRVAGLLLAEGGLVAALGCVAGAGGGLGYAWLMLAGLRTWWSAAVNAPFLRLHVSAASLVIGSLLTLLVVLAAIAWSLRGLARQSPRALLAGDARIGGRRDEAAFCPQRRRGMCWSGWLCVAALTLAGALALGGLFLQVPPTLAFFGTGVFMLIAALAALRSYLRWERGPLIHRPGPMATLRLALRNATRNPGRSLLTAGLLASATFVIAAVGAFRLDPPGGDERQSGTGGFDVYAETTAPLAFDLRTTAGREKLNIPQADRAVLAGATIMPFRLRPGDDASCRNLYGRGNPRILGAGDEFLARGGFSFSAAAAGGQQVDNPWTLLQQPLPDGAVPAIGDEASVRWQLHSGVGQDYPITNERGESVRLRFVALLSGSCLQDELIISEPAFLQLFPSTSGYSFFLLDAQSGSPAAAIDALSRGLADSGCEAGTTAGRLAEYLAVQNTYLSTFQTLGGLGLLLGGIGLGVVLMRNVWERRRELALLRALGYSDRAIRALVLIEHAALAAFGLLAGVIPALVASAPVALSRPASIPWASSAATLLAVVLAGLAFGAAALRPLLRAPLLAGLRAE